MIIGSRITNESIQDTLRIVSLESIMESPDHIVPSRRLPPREHHAHPATSQEVTQTLRAAAVRVLKLQSTRRVILASWAWPDRGALLDGLLRGVRREEVDERLAEGAREGLRDDVRGGGVDGGGRVAVLHSHRRSLR